MREEKGFHAYKSVAPLKPLATCTRRGRATEFPRLQKRGPIEARVKGVKSRIDPLFPRLQKRGPIEAGACRWLSRSWWAFPRLQKRGPIEAGQGELGNLFRSGFHAYKSVAPLKPQLSCWLNGVQIAVSTLTKAWPH